MAITRCPYCHAIIDETDKYCNNCGTQLLFSEDEAVEEEIPGEKIVDAVIEEKDYTVDEPDSEKRQRPSPAKDLDAEIDKELRDELPDGTSKTAIEELMAGDDLEDEEGEEEPPEEVILVDEIEASEAKGKTGEINAPGPIAGEGTGEPEVEVEDEDEEPENEAIGEDEDLEDEIEEEPVREPEAAAKPDKDETRAYSALPPKAAEIASPAPDQASGPPEGPETEYVLESGEPGEAATAGEASLRPVTFDSQELEDLGKTVDLGREKIDKFIEAQAAKRTETGPVPAEPESVPEGQAEPAAPKPPVPPTGALPPWASTMKGAPVFPEDTGPVRAPKVRGATPDTEETEIFPRRRDSDSTIGLPEKVSQSPLPFEAAAAEEEDEEELEARREEEAGEERAGEPEAEREAGQQAVTDEEAEAEAAIPPARESILSARGDGPSRLAQAEVLPSGEIEEPAPRPPFSLSVFFKSKVFDLLFVGLFWLVALWLAAASMDVTLFDILGSMSGSVILLYAVFLFLYFFLFKFFLGETIGDRLFRSRERD